MGRPPDYTTELADTICARLAAGESLTAICADPEMPARSTVYLWLDQHPSFSDGYARARDQGVLLLADELVAIADETAGDVTTGERGGRVVDYENIQRSKLRVDTRKWLLSKLLPKTYGERTQLEHSGPGGAPLPPPVMIYLPANGRDDEPTKPEM